ncbi:hypothetical protein GCM10008941_27360 [Rhizomicrobium palustre]
MITTRKGPSAARWFALKVNFSKAFTRDIRSMISVLGSTRALQEVGAMALSTTTRGTVNRFGS